VVTEKIRERLLNGAQPYELIREGFNKATVYWVRREMVKEGLLEPLPERTKGERKARASGAGEAWRQWVPCPICGFESWWYPAGTPVMVIICPACHEAFSPITGERYDLPPPRPVSRRRGGFESLGDILKKGEET